MKISIITPSFNSELYIEKAIKSIIEQGYEDYEHIIVDGNSKDGTLDILKKYPHLRWISEPDNGQSDALNKGFRMANGEIIGWLNADEEYYPGTFEKINRIFDTVDTDIVYGNYISFTDGKAIPYHSIPYVKQLLNFRQFVNTCTLFFKRRIIDDNNLLREDLHAAMDKEYLVRLEKKGYRFYFLNEYLGKFYWHADNKSLKIRNIQINEGREIIKKYVFNDNEILFFTCFWPIKYYFDITYKLKKILNA